MEGRPLPRLLAKLLGSLADERVDALEVAAAAVGAVQSEDVGTGLDHLGDHLLTDRFPLVISTLDGNSS